MQKIPGCDIWKERHQGTTENSNTGHCTHTSESTSVKLQDVCHGE